MGITSPRFHANWYQQTLLWTGIIATLAAAVLAFSAEAASKLYVYLDAKAEAAQPGLHEIKRQLAESLAKLNRPVLVVTDDIDRLTPGQIRLVFQLVKANGDFPNLIYLLLFDKPFIEKAIATDGVSDGSAFLDKIVQVGFDIPHISPHQLDAALEDTVRKIVVAASEINERFDPFRWARTFPRIRPYFHTLRDVKRFAGSLEFQVQLFREGGHFNANPIDLIGLETLRQFEGTLYSRIPSTRAALTGESSLDFHIGDDDRQKAVKALLSEAKDAPSAQEIVEDLFPIAGMITSGGKTQGGLNLQWFKELRVAHPDNFERYFRLTLSSDDISEAEFAQLLSATFNAEKLTAMLRDFAGRGLLVTAIVRLRAELGNLSIDNIVPVMTALFDVERELMNVRQNASMGSVPVDFLALGLISGYLRRIDDRTKRAGLLRDAVSQTEGFILPCLAFEPAKDASADPLIETDELPRFRDLCLGKIRSAAASGALLSHPKRGNASYFWREWTGAPAEVGDWMNTVVNSDAGLAAILTALTEGMNIVEGSRVAQTKWMFNLDELSKYIDPEALASSAADLKSKSADEFVRTACETFLEELEARRKGERTKNRHPSELV
jgi:predicted KAP-like P-loop ATPase